MFEKFGELNSFGEINELAENLFNEGDTESLRAMAEHLADETENRNADGNNPDGGHSVRRQTWNMCR